MAEWQLVQARSSNCGDGELPPAPGARPRPLNAALVWMEPPWQLWHNQGGRTFSSGAMLEPCATWQLLQSSEAGGCSHRKGPRLSAWHPKQVSLTVFARKEAGPVDPCGLWQSLQVTAPLAMEWVDR